jgi:hypothetical protein
LQNRKKVFLPAQMAKEDISVLEVVWYETSMTSQKMIPTL